MPTKQQPEMVEPKTACNFRRDEDGAYLEVTGRIDNADEAAELVGVLIAMCQAAFGQTVVVGQEAEELEAIKASPPKSNGKSHEMPQ